MKKSSFLFLIALIAISLTSFAQKTFIGTISYSVECSGEELDAQTKAQLPTDMIITTNGLKTRSEQIAPMFTMAQVFDHKTGAGIILIDIMGQKIAAEMSKEYFDETKEKAGLNATEEPTINYIDETKTIAGYKCKKAEVVNNDGETMEVYYTEDIILSDETKDKLITGMKGLKGIPMEYTMTSQGISMKFKVKEVLAKKPKSGLFVIDDDYQKMTMEEFLQMMGGGVE
ncbi:MAG: hypothetical protein LBV69_02125 [Bacteroidales bacterium]|jgi:hypothetical protein|nr:hypothetical protein [Bacteroidales bacterium]